MAQKVRRLVAIAMVASLLQLCGCASLEVDPDGNAGQKDVGPVEDNLTYNLAETTFVVTGTVTLNDCDSIVAQALVDNDNAMTKASATGAPTHVETLPTSSPPIDVSSTFTVASIQQADPNFQYQIPYKSLEGWTKQLNLTVGRNSNKTLLSINGTITDQAGPVILAAAQTAITIGGAVAVPALTPLAIASTDSLTQAATDAKASNLFIKNLGKGDFAAAAALTKRGKSDEYIDFAKVGLRALQRDNKALTPPTSPTVCSGHVEEGLRAIAEEQVIIANGVKPVPAGSSNATPSNPEVLRAQTRITELQAQYQLTRQFTITWTPSRDNLIEEAHFGDNNYILHKDYELYSLLISPAWLMSPVPPEVASSEVFTQLKRPLRLDLYVQPWTVGHVYGDKTFKDDKRTESKPDGFPDGIVYRDPALATLRACLGSCSGTPALASSVGVNDDLNNELIETTTDVMPATTVSVVQFGRVYVQPLRNVLFQTSAATLTLNPDGSIASVGTQSSSAAASGFAAATTAAGAQASAVAARNTAVAAQNTVNSTQATLADTVNKAAADCMQQVQQIIAAGKKPPMSCP